MLTAAKARPFWKFALIVELRFWVCLYRWVTRRPLSLADGEQPFGYTKAAMPVIWVFIFVSIIEIPAVHVLIPWEWLRIVMLLISIWGLEWMFGLVASLKTNPHTVGPAGLRLRNGVTLDLTVPWELIDSVRTIREFPESNRQLIETDTGPMLQLVQGNQVNLLLTLKEPTVVQLRACQAEVSHIRLYADDPVAFAAATEQQLARAAT